MVNLTKRDRLKIRAHYDYMRKFGAVKIDLSIGSFYVKFVDKEEMLNEFLGKKVFDIVGIKCPSYYFDMEEKCILSENLANNKMFFLGKLLGRNHNTIKDIKDCLEIKKNNLGIFTNVEDIMFEVIMMHFIDILFMNMDRHSSNYGFILNRDRTGRLAVFDNGFFFRDMCRATLPLSYEGNNVRDCCSYTRSEEIEYFLTNLSSDEKNKNIIMVLFKTFTPPRVKKLISLIERENNQTFGCKWQLLRKYAKNYREIGELLLSLGYTYEKSSLGIGYSRKKKK